jgi:hypothetical protein
MFSYTELPTVTAHFNWFIFCGFVLGGALISILISILIDLVVDDFFNISNTGTKVFAVLMCGVLFVSIQIADTPTKVPENVKYTATYDHLESVRSGKSGYATKIVYRLENGDTIMMPYSDGQVVNKTVVLYYNK